MLAPLTIENSGCHRCNQMKSAALPPLACMNAARDTRGKSEWGCSFLRCVCEWPRSSHRTKSRCILTAPSAAAVQGLRTSVSGLYHFQFHRNNWKWLYWWNWLRLWLWSAGWILERDWESRCLGRPSFSEAFVTSLRNDPWMRCVCKRDMNQRKGI